MSFAVAEKFVSINGESIRAGEPAVFIRFTGCNLACSYCDTKWANAPGCPAEQLTAQEIADYVQSTGITNVTLTGGEPLLQKDLPELIALLTGSGHRVELETNGSQPIAQLSGLDPRPVFTLDYKLPSSGMESAMLTGNYKYLSGEDAVKFVSGSIDDLERAAQIIEKYSLTEKCRVYLSPVFGAIDPADMVSFMIERKLNGVRLQLQLHKFIWDPEKRGV
ncbi:MAG: putative 7-carboxy-7-deazaguanine synthase QueE [Ruminococcus sp.]|nr:putative 7-carboxy-7-deazaguanine synthase QueE [Ruminococcus sp.]